MTLNTNCFLSLFFNFDRLRFLSFRSLSIAICLFINLVLPSQGWTAPVTEICNRSNETVYVTVRDFELLRLLGGNKASTEGWVSVPTGSFLTGCRNWPRTRAEQYLVIGVLRNQEVVPIKVDLKGVRNNLEVDICVRSSRGSFEYGSQSRSDSSCQSGYRPARASFGVLGGDNDVSVKLRGDYSGVRSSDVERSVDELYAPRKIKIINNCIHDAKLALRYIPSANPGMNPWSGSYQLFSTWISLPGKKATYLTDGNQYIMTNQPVIYIYAESEDKALVWSGDNKLGVENSDLVFPYIEVGSHGPGSPPPGNDLSYTFTCN